MMAAIRIPPGDTRTIVARKKRDEAKRIRTVERAEGRFELGTRIVDDPYEPGAKIEVPANICADPILRMFNRGDIDEGQFQTAERIRLHLENTGGRGASAVDPTKEPVDGSPKHRDVSASVLASVREIVRCQRVVGFYTWRVVVGFIWDGLNGALISQASMSKVDRRHVIGVLKDGLDTIGEMWGIVSGPQHSNKRRAILAFLNETPHWEHEENVIGIKYVRKGEKGS